MSSPISPTKSGGVPAIPVDDPLAFSGTPGQLALRPYQAAPLEAIVDSVRHRRGLSFVVIFPRQSGKNETQAALYSYLLFLFSRVGGDMIAVSPTYRPQAENAMTRLEHRLRNNLLTRGTRSRSGYIYQLGATRVVFFSAEPASRVVGATANILLSVDEAQDVSITKYDKEFEPMVASTNATRVFWGTRWTSDTLLEREYVAALNAEQADREASPTGDYHQRVFFITADDVTPVVPAYAEHMQNILRKHGRDHPLVKTQYYGETIDAQLGMFPPARMALLQATPNYQPSTEMPKAFLIDCAGTDEASRGGSLTRPFAAEDLTNPGRDSTTLSMVAIDLSEIGTLGAPIYRVYDRRSWTGADPVQVFGQVVALAEMANPQYFVVDGTGVGDGLAALLTRRYGPDRVLVVRFNAAVKSDIGYRLISIVNTGRLRLHSFASAVRLQYQHARSEVLPGPENTMRWGVPDGARDPQTGELIHDDYLLADSLVAVLDRLNWTPSTPATIIEQPDPLEGADYAF